MGEDRRDGETVRGKKWWEKRDKSIKWKSEGGSKMWEKVHDVGRERDRLSLQRQT